MSRSYKKPYRKDHPKGIKRIEAKRIRSRYRQITWVWSKGWYPWDVEGDYMDPDYPHRNLIMNPYTYCDWIWYDPDNPKNYRK